MATVSAKKRLIQSILCGINIGFICGFIGAGGGMMMLIVFTAMLGYERKTAVGTSTFIMTFTALIASVSHILIEPTILLECWDFLLIAIVAATFFSLVSARFANRVKGKVVGYVTGAILLVLGLSMIIINNLDKIVKNYAGILSLCDYDPQKVGKNPQSYTQALNWFKMAVAGIL